MDVDKINKFILHPAINQSWVAEQLWGSKESKFRTKLSRRVSGRNPWKEEELEKMVLIISTIQKDISET